MKINWKQKFSSRKFWALLAALVLSILMFFNIGDNEAGKVSAVIGAFGSICVYTLAEANVDKARVNEEIYEEDEYVE